MCHFGLSVATWSSLVEERADQSPRRLLMYRSWLSCQSKGPPAVVSLSLFILFLKKKKKDGRRFAGPQSIRLLVGTWRRQAPTSIPTLQGEPKLSLSSKGRKFGRQTRSTYTKKQKTHVCNTKCTNIYLFLFRADEPSYSSETSRQRQQRR